MKDSKKSSAATNKLEGLPPQPPLDKGGISSEVSHLPKGGRRGGDSSPVTHHSLLLLEIGTEEIPARFLPDAINKLREISEKIFVEHRIPASNIKAYATPRRLSLIAELSKMQEAAEKEIWGPPVNAAFDKDGKPLKAAEAFAKAHGISAGDLIKKEKGKGVYVAALIKEKAQQTEKLMPEIVQKIIQSLNFPKSMRWGSGSFRFARPVHWLLATYDNKKIPFETDGLKSSNNTRGHRFLSPAVFEIKDSRAYTALLRNNYVIVDPEERKKIIIENYEKLASSVNCAVMKDEELLNHVTFLVEYPSPVLCSFSHDYLSLPKELLITVMKSHQKYFAVEDGKGGLSNYFIAVSNTKHDNAETVRKGAEKVIKARFEDARFYYEEDKKTTLKERLEGLKKVIYHDRLGTLYDKCARISAIADFISDRCFRFEQLEQFKQDVHTAALLSKADLISGVVREFPELQGIMGGYYASNDGLGDEASKAIAEHYLPAYSGDRLPETDIGAIISLSDKLDNLASFFMLGLAPTSTEDPFALRRQTIGIISILSNKNYDLNIAELFNKALEPYNLENKENVINDLLRFTEQRFEPLFATFGYPADSIAATISLVKDKPLYTVRQRLDAIQIFKKEADYASFLLAIKRVNNIAPKDSYELKVVSQDLFGQQEEKELYGAFEAVTPQINSLLDENKYYDALKALMSLKEPINGFFDKVLVMDKDETVKQNRLSLIKSIQVLAFQIIDFSKLS